MTFPVLDNHNNIMLADPFANR